MKTPPNLTAFESAPDKANYNSTKFSGTNNPRELRAYHLTDADRSKLAAWMRLRDSKAGGAL